MVYCLICGVEYHDNGTWFDGYWFDDIDCVLIYCTWMEKDYMPQEQKIAA